MAARKRLRVFLVVGGDSSEKDVSLESGKSIYGALRELGHHVVVSDPARADIDASESPDALFTDAAIESRPPEIAGDVFEARRRFVEALGEFHKLGCDVVFNGLHGGAGEDGTFQAVLDYLGIPYTGSGACACALAMNKELAKRVVAHAEVPVARHILVDSPSHENVVVDEKVVKALSLPVVVKPNHEGSSVGVTIVDNRKDLRKAMAEAKRYGGSYLVERYVPGREITAAVLDFCELPLLEIRPKDGFFDYRNKYQKGACDYLVPAPLDDASADAVAASARTAYRALGCRGYARIDFRVTDDGHHFFLEANTLPGLTSSSLVPKAAAGGGIGFTELIDRILRLSVAGDPS